MRKMLDDVDPQDIVALLILVSLLGLVIGFILGL